MTSSDEMLKRTSFLYHEKIKKSSAPLSTYFSITHFSYVKITNSSRISILSNRPEWLEHYLGEKFYLVQPHFRRHPNTYQTGITLPGQIPDREYRSAMEIAQNDFLIHPGLVITQKRSDGVELFGFDLKCSTPILNELLINELPLLRKFTEKFREENIFLFNLLDDYQFDLQDIMGKDFRFDTENAAMTLPNRNLCLREMGFGLDKSATLSTREIEVLQFLLQGASASIIAEELNLSKRTIEHYVERLKNKLVCYSKMELIAKAREIEQLGYLCNIS
ncbi:MAG: response regulator transcription factor [Parachlamydiaceae bacterium]|nr:response regulator transcription factor [Parachlamydiaceae bacterium]